MMVNGREKINPVGLGNCLHWCLEKLPDGTLCDTEIDGYDFDDSNYLNSLSSHYWNVHKIDIQKCSICGKSHDPIMDNPCEEESK